MTCTGLICVSFLCWITVQRNVFNFQDFVQGMLLSTSDLVNVIIRLSILSRRLSGTEVFLLSSGSVQKIKSNWQSAYCLPLLKSHKNLWLLERKTQNILQIFFACPVCLLHRLRYNEYDLSVAVCKRLPPRLKVFVYHFHHLSLAC